MRQLSGLTIFITFVLRGCWGNLSVTKVLSGSTESFDVSAGESRYLMTNVKKGI